MHTPGPWRIYDRVKAAGNILVTDSSGVVGIARTIGSQANAGADIDQKANAALIAAAPDMLAALKAWQALRESTEDGTDAVGEIERTEAMMRAAIRNAEPKKEPQ